MSNRANIDFKLDSNGVRELLNSSELMEYMQTYGEGVAMRAGEGYAADTRPGDKRAHTFVKATTAHAYYSNLKHNSLLKALQT